MVEGNFNVIDACYLFFCYKEKNQNEKANLIIQLVEFQNALFPKSISGTEILLNRKYKLETVEAVLADLNYSLVSFKTESVPKFLRKPKNFTIISFKKVE